jgi:hypothetical protein
MKRIATVVCAAIGLTGLAFGIGSPIVVDSTQPLPPLTRIEAWQGQRLVVIPTLRQGGS